MKNKKGFISTSIIYSFFIVFLLIMLSMLASYINKRYLTVKYEEPKDVLKSKCSDLNLPLAQCLILNDKICKDSSNPTECVEKKLTTSLTDKEQILVKANSECVADADAGLRRTQDNFGTTLYYTGNVKNNYVYYAGYMWQIVRINGDDDHSVRLIYAGEATGSTNPKLDKSSKPYILVKDVYSDLGGEYSQYTDQNVYKTRYNYFWVLRKNQDTMGNIQYNLISGDNPLANVVGDYITRDDILKYMAQVTQGNNKLDDYLRTIPGGILLWNIGYMNNHSHTETYDNLLDNQNDSELKMWVDMWYQKNIESKDEYRNNIYWDSIFCGEKNLTSYQNNNENNSLITDIIDRLENITAGRFTFDSYNRIGDNDSRPKNGTGATIVCPNTGGLVNNNPFKNMLGSKVINLSNYSASNTDEKLPYLIYEKCTGNGCYRSTALNWVSEKINSDNCSWQWVDTGAYYYWFGQKKPIKVYIKKCEESNSSSTSDPETDTSSNNNKTYYWSNNTSTSLITTKWKNEHQINPSPVKKFKSYEYTKEGNNQLTYPIGLLSADEAVYAGARVNDSCSTYLDQTMPNQADNGLNTFWTMTLAYTNIGFSDSDGEGNGARYYIVVKNNNKTMLSKKSDSEISTSNLAGSYMRPVINIKNIDFGNYCANGDDAGTWDNPYIIGGDCNAR